MSVSPPDDPGAGKQDATTVHVDHSHGTQIGDHGAQNSRVTLVTAAGRDALSAGRDFHLHLEHGDGIIQAFSPGAPRLAYLEQVRRIAPPDPPGLQDRAAELAELARFCLDPDAPAYAWWRAEAWAGKSALLSTFVLRPPPELNGRVQILSFFITARLAAQDNRDSFTQVLLEQLAELTGQVLPAALPESTRDGYLLSLLSQAASQCQQAGGRLVLVLDGLDEDRGVTIGPDAHSIAALLPADPPAGMRVIVAGRPNPPIPDDVPSWHPLRDPKIVHLLTSSPHARDMQHRGRQEIHRLLVGGVPGRDLLGLLAAARGGLSRPDLAELTQTSLWEIEEILHTVAGRTFTHRRSRWAPGTGPEVYLLGHEELQALAVHYLGERMDAYRDRLHEWYDVYRDRGWPEKTPEYLLSGYFSLLTSAEDLPRMIRCASDAARHDLMLRMTGGDGAALTEARTVLDRIAAQETPDVSHALVTAHHRDQLAERNSSIPSELPAVWASVGQVARAEALAASAADPHMKVMALVKIAEAMVKTGYQQQASTITAEAEIAARAITDLRWRTESLALVAGVMTKTGQHRNAAMIMAEAESAARTYIDPQLQVHALGRIAEILIEAGQHQRADVITSAAKTTAQAIADPRSRVIALLTVTSALFKAGKQHEAAMVANQAGTAARAVTDPQEQASALASAAEALAKAGQHHDAETIALIISDPGHRARALTEIAKALAEAGDHERTATIVKRAERTAQAIDDPQRRGFRLARLAGVLSEGGQYPLAETLARAITDNGHQAAAMASLAKALAKTGRHEDAETIALTISDPGPQADSLTAIAEVLSDAGKHEDAIRIAVQAETAARSIVNQRRRAAILAVIAVALAETGHHEDAVTMAVQAEAAVRFITHPEDQAEALASVSEALAKAGQHKDALMIAVRAETLARSITDPRLQAWALKSVAVALADAGEHQKAEGIVRSFTDHEVRLEALAQVAGVLSRAGEHEDAVRIAVEAETLSQSGTSPRAQAIATAEAAWNLAWAGQREQAIATAARAESVARSITERAIEQAQAMPYVAGAMAATGQYEKAEAIARSITDHSDLKDQALALIVDALTRSGHYQQAEEVAHTIADPDIQAAVLSQIAETLAEGGNPSRLVG